MAGIIHPYYTVALAPAIGALVGIGGVTVWRHRAEPGMRGVFAGTVAATALWSFVLLGRATGWHPQLRWVVLLAGLGVAGALLVPQLAGRTALVGAVAAVVVALLGSAAYAVQTASTAHTGAIPSAGPASAGGVGGRGGPGGGGFSGGNWATGSGSNSNGNGFGQPPGGTNGGASGPGGGRQGGPGGGGFGGAGGLLDATTPSSDLVKALQDNASRYRWVAAVTGSNNAAGYQLGTGDPVMAIGGFNGTDAAPTLAQFQAYVKAGQIHYYVSASLMGGSSGSDAASQIAQWVADNYTATTVGGLTLYDLGGAQ